LHAIAVTGAFFAVDLIGYTAALLMAVLLLVLTLRARKFLGEDEVLLDDSLRYGERLASGGGTVQIHTWQGMIHVFPSNVALLHAAKEALDDIGDFLRQQFVGDADDAGGLISRSTASIEGRLR